MNYFRYLFLNTLLKGELRMSDVILPREVEEEKIGRGGMVLAHAAFNYEHWDFRLESGSDVGRDCSFEYVDDHNSWFNRTLHAQVKATKVPDNYKLKTKDCFSFCLEIKTINYALRSNDAFLLLFCVLTTKKVYYLPIQDYFINNEEMYEKLEMKNKGKIALHIPFKNIVNADNEAELIELTRASYCFRNNRVHKEFTD